MKTPETDAAQHEGLIRTIPISMQVVTSNFARKLERERNEAREKYDNLATEHMLVVNKLCGERDEAREAAHSFRSSYYASSGKNKAGCAFPWEAQ